MKVLQGARPEDKAEVYRQLGASITYRHNDKTALAEVKPEPSMWVVVVSGGGFEHLPDSTPAQGRCSCAEAYGTDALVDEVAASSQMWSAEDRGGSPRLPELPQAATQRLAWALMRASRRSSPASLAYAWQVPAVRELA
jgi:hypothetical protein